MAIGWNRAVRCIANTFSIICDIFRDRRPNPLRIAFPTIFIHYTGSNFTAPDRCQKPLLRQ